MSKVSKELFAVVTGASQGLGKAFAIALAKRKINVILISLPNQGLAKIAADISQTYNIKTDYFETDFSSDQNIISAADWINSNYNTYILINNAGTGGAKKFDSASINYINTIIQVNTKAPALLIRSLLPNFKKQKQAYILNVSSIAAFSPVGYKTVYPASKTFIHSLSIGLSEELKYTNISVSVINPGAMKTNPEVTSRIEKQGFLGKLTLLDTTKVAQSSLQQMFQKRTFILLNPISWLTSILLPNWIKVPLITNAIKKEIVHE